MTFRQFMNLHLLKKNWNPSNANYVLNFSKAVDFTRKLALAPPNFVKDENLSFSKVEREELCNEILDEFYSVRGFEVGDMALNCWLRSRDLQQFLVERFNISSTITSGNVYMGYQQLFYESNRSIKNRIVDETPKSPPRFHTWLTLSNYSVVDITLAPTIWLDSHLSGNSLPLKDHLRMFWYNYWETPKEQLFYQPIFLGYDYFNKIRIIPKVIPFLREVKV